MDIEKCRKNVITIFCLVKEVKDVMLNKFPVVSKKAWSNLFWNRAWQLDDANSRASNAVLKDNDFLSLIVGDIPHLSCWEISDLDYRLTRMSETMSKNSKSCEFTKKKRTTIDYTLCL